jgi:hypothetical protein
MFTLYAPIWYVHLVCMFKLTFNKKNCLFRLCVPFVNLVVEKSMFLNVDTFK